ncbi:NAD-dependent epimerase/dehydratase [Beutenbergia cavernae DSM 12333]|uniref:NAD-dependent epimerase/dehydratase n=1 Tax=Beutenbergia cavernae (strain ATCC BAA-8 / DSM 12333 / CCUG 43141 / JCM 11478 / NBRC 16432 / NCIMB 13614 / HKI 0122) TaxID=471853 RepID=C5C124_BEUC1|nr:NAD-dependent epimerase/dehydratase family protein [Beutenbergia cavernae]ACQ79428.1 NAD-dependent epimerase/dehydratase [Beutenbergia cavernae DSM 12333]
MATVLTADDRLLVLGGSGFIGSHLPRQLARLGIEFDTFDLYPFDPVPGAPLPRRQTIGDVRDLGALTRAMEGCTAVLNLAAAHHDFGIPPATFESVNVGGAHNVVAAMQAHGITNLCFYSSVAVYGSGHDVPPDETTPPAPENDYGRTKLAAEGVYRAWQADGEERRLLTIRPAVVFGPRNFANVYRLIRQIDRRRFVPVGPGRNRKSMAYVTNLVEAILHVWTRPPGDVRTDGFEVYNYADKPDLTSREVVSVVYRSLGRREPGLRLPLAPAVWAAKPFDLVAHLTGRNLPITSDRIRKLSDAETSFGADRIRATGFTPRISLVDGLRRMVGWYRDQGRDAAHVDHLPPEQP